MVRVATTRVICRTRHHFECCASQYMSSFNHFQHLLDPSSLQLLARLWTVSHSSEHLEGVPSMPSRLNPSKFAPSPTSSPNRIPPSIPYQGSIPSEAPAQMLNQGARQAGPDNAYIAGYGQASDNFQRQPQSPHQAWNGVGSPPSPFMQNEQIQTSFSEWQDREHSQTLANLGQTQLPKHQLELIPETSERMSIEQSSSNMHQMFSKPSAPEALNAVQQPHTDQQTNGMSHMTEWQHHTSLTDT